MKLIEIFMLIFISIPAILAILIFISFIINEIKYKKIKKKYPEVFELIKEREKSMSNSCKFYNEKILPLKNKIDYILNEQKYLTEEKSKSLNDELEILRVELAYLKETYDKVKKEEHLLNEEIENIIRSKTDLLIEMQKYGWCKGE